MRQKLGVPGWGDFEIFRVGKLEKFPQMVHSKIETF